jgi:iron complex outermembrane receptor protein
MPGGYYEAWEFYRIRGFDASFNTYVDGLRGGHGMGEEMFGAESVEVLKGLRPLYTGRVYSAA